MAHPPSADFASASPDQVQNLSQKLEAAYTKTKALEKARKLVMQVADVEGLPSRDHFAKLAEWAPLLEHEAYIHLAAQGIHDVASNIGDVQRGANETGCASSQVLLSSGQSARLSLASASS